MPDESFRANVLRSMGATPSEEQELLTYNASQFDASRLRGCVFPLADEPFVATWEQYAADAKQTSVLDALRPRIVQLRFPIRENLSQTDNYGAATRRGISPDSMPEATGLTLESPETLQLSIHATRAGRLPVLVIPHRADFVSLVQALAGRNEPKPIPPSMGASIVSGLNNWDRVRRYRQEWEAGDPARSNEAAWKQEFQRIVPRKDLYQDRVILLSTGRYSGVEAKALELAEDEWSRLSLAIRREHECTHYFTLRVFGSMRNNLFDEFLADFAGIVAAAGEFHAKWFLHFMGLERFPEYREGGRLQNYRGQPPLSDGALRILQRLVYQAALNIEAVTRPRLANGMNVLDGLLAMTLMTLEELASEQAAEFFDRANARQQRLRTSGEA